MIAPLLPAFLVGSLGASRTWLGAVEGAADSATSLLKPWAGRRSDRAGRRKPWVVVGYAIPTVVRPLVAFTTQAWQVLVVRVLDRTGKGLRSAPRDALLRDSVGPERSGRAFGLQRAMDHAGALGGALLGAALLAIGLEQRTLFLVAFLPGLVSVASLVLVREPPAPTSAAPGDPSAPLPPRLRSWLLPVALFGLASSSDKFLVLRAVDVGVPLAAVLVLWAALHVVKTAVSYVAGSLADRVPRVRVLLAGWALFALSYAGFGLATEAWHAWVLFLLHGVHQGLAEPTERALVGDLAPRAARGRAYGVYGLVQGAVVLPASLLTGFLWDEAGAAPAFLASSGLAADATLALAAWARR
jgi:MFS family permease